MQGVHGARGGALYDDLGGSCIDPPEELSVCHNNIAEVFFHHPGLLRRYSGQPYPLSTIYVYLYIYLYVSVYVFIFVFYIIYTHIYIYTQYVAY